MSALNDMMIKILGANWRTSVTGISNALLSIGGGGGFMVALLSDKYKIAAAVVAFILCALSGIAKILMALATADAANKETSTSNPP